MRSVMSRGAEEKLLFVAGIRGIDELDGNAGRLEHQSPLQSSSSPGQACRFEFTLRPKSQISRRQCQKENSFMQADEIRLASWRRSKSSYQRCVLVIGLTKYCLCVGRRLRSKSPSWSVRSVNISYLESLNRTLFEVIVNIGRDCVRNGENERWS